MLFRSPAALLLIFATVTGNAGNMFQGTLVVSTLFTRFPKWQITVALGVLAVIVGSMDIMAWFIPFLLFLGIATRPWRGFILQTFCCIGEVDMTSACSPATRK